ncbi:MAG: DUF4388 domain-containing protein [Acidimicrobiales bacterium]
METKTPTLGGHPVSLQGTLDTFALPDVLRLLASTRKTGHLRLEGSRGTGGVWFADGAVAAIDAPTTGSPVPAPPSADALCDLLRSPDGAFSFEAGASSPVSAEPGDLGDLLAEAEELLVEWRALAAVVPSLDCSLALRPELEGESTTVSAADWRLLVAIGSGTTVGQLGASLDLGELAVSRAVNGLVECGLAVVGSAPGVVVPSAPEPVAAEVPFEDLFELDQVDEVQEPDGLDEDTVEPALAPELEAEEPAPEPEPVPEPEQVADAVVRRPLAARPAMPRGPGLGMPLSASLGELASLGGSKRPFPGSSPPDEVDDEEQAELAQQLADLGPEAVAAVVAAAADASTSEERDAAVDVVIDAVSDAEPVNRSALLKFLSSVRL